MISSLPLTPGLTPAENVPLLAGANLYMDAVGSCQIYTLPASLVSVVQTEQLRQRRRHCLGLGWQRTDKLEAGRQAGRRARTRWRPLLEHIVTRQEARGQTSLHGAVLCKLAQARCAAPPWLLAGYKRRDINPHYLSQLVSHSNRAPAMTTESGSRHLELVQHE